MLSGSRASGPASAPSSSAASATVRAIGPLWPRAAQMSIVGHSGTRPSEGLNPNTPQNAAGIRIEPAPSEPWARSEEHTSELQSQSNLVCRLLLEKKNNA